MIPLGISKLCRRSDMTFPLDGPEFERAQQTFWNGRVYDTYWSAVYMVLAVMADVRKSEVNLASSIMLFLCQAWTAFQLRVRILVAAIEAVVELFAQVEQHLLKTLSHR